MTFSISPISRKKYDFSSLLFVFHLLIYLKANNLFSNTKSIEDLHYIEKPNLLDVLSSFVDVMSVDVLSVDVMSVDVLSYIRETWTLLQDEINRLQALEMWLWRGLEKVS